MLHRLQIRCVSEDCLCLPRGPWLSWTHSVRVCLCAPAGLCPGLPASAPPPQPRIWGPCACAVHARRQPSLPVSCFQVPLPVFPLPCVLRHFPPGGLRLLLAQAALQEGVSGALHFRTDAPHTPPSGQRRGSRLQTPPWCWWSPGRQIQGSDFAPLCDSTGAPSLPFPAFADSLLQAVAWSFL